MLMHAISDVVHVCDVSSKTNQAIQISHRNANACSWLAEVADQSHSIKLSLVGCLIQVRDRDLVFILWREVTWSRGKSPIVT